MADGTPPEAAGLARGAAGGENDPGSSVRGGGRDAAVRGEPGAPSLPRSGVREPGHRPHPARVGDARKYPTGPGDAVPGRGAGDPACPARPALPLRGPTGAAGGGGGVAARVHPRRARVLDAGRAHSVPAPGAADVSRVPGRRRPGSRRAGRRPGPGHATDRRCAPSTRPAASRVPRGRRIARGGIGVLRVGFPHGGGGRPAFHRLDLRGRLRQVRPAGAPRPPAAAVPPRAPIRGAARELPPPRPGCARGESASRDRSAGQGARMSPDLPQPLFRTAARRRRRQSRRASCCSWTSRRWTIPGW